MRIRFRDEDGKLRVVNTKKVTVEEVTRVEASDGKWVFIDENI